MAKHIYIIDTCVLLHDPFALYKFKENDIYIPLAVIDDLDDIKTKRDNIGFAAREVFRQLENYTLQDLIKGVKINDENGKIFVYNTESPLQKNERPNIVKVHSDNAIIECCLALKAVNPRKKVCIVTKDTGLRIRAITWGCNGENYKADLLDVQDYTGVRQIECTNDVDWKNLWASEALEITKLSPELQESLGEYYPNEFLIFNYGDAKCPTYNKNGFLKVLKEKSNTDRKAYMGIEGKNLEQKCALEALYDKSVALVTLTGKAGCGKSFLAIASALQQINEGTYEKIIVMKPLIPVGGKDIGALPGDKFEKISAWLGPIKDNIDQILGSRSLSSNNMFEEMVREGIIEVEAMAYIQGRSIPRSIILLDECLVAGSMIYMADGSVKKIEDIVDGDEVVSFNTNNLSWTSNKVSNKFSRQTEELVEITTNKSSIKCTLTHQMWVKRWNENTFELIKKQAKDITLDDMIIYYRDEDQKIISLNRINETCEVYDFTVENTHTFVVNGMLSSNCQNITNREARMVVERCGKDSKVILLGDLSQVENPYLDAQSNGLAHAVNGGMKSQLVASILLRKVERSELAAVASEIFNRPEHRR